MVAHAKRFDVFWVSLDPTIGAEIKKTRPCLIVSPNEANRRLLTVIIAPLTTKPKHYAFRPLISMDGKECEVALDQLRCIDQRRLHKKMGTLQRDDAIAVTRLLQEMFA